MGIYKWLPPSTYHSRPIINLTEMSTNYGNGSKPNALGKSLEVIVEFYFRELALSSLLAKVLRVNKISITSFSNMSFVNY